MMRRNKTNFVLFKEGEKVWLDSRNLKIPYESRKLAPKREGPLVVEEVLGRSTYRLTIPEDWKNKRVHNVFHAIQLTPYHETAEHGPNYIKPPPDVIDGEKEYEVEAILASRPKGKGIEYLIRWKGYGTNEDSWQPERNLSHMDKMLKEYKMKYPSKDAPISSNRKSLSPSSEKSFRC